jgi:hypothetical protein
VTNGLRATDRCGFDVALRIAEVIERDTSVKNDRISASSVKFTFWLLIPLFARTEAEFSA